MREFTEPKEIVSAARAKLAALAPVRRQSGPTSPRRVIADQTTFVNDVSPDGRLAVGLTAGLDTRLVLQDPSTGETTTLVAGTQAAFGRWPVFSADGQQLAYSWTERGSGTGSLRVVGTSAGAPSRTILAADPERGQVMPLGWSADGKAILALLGGGRIAWIAVADGAVRVIKSLEAWRKVPSVDANNGLVYPRLSPDGNSIAYSAVARDGSPDRYIYVIDANGQNEATVVSVAGANTHPVWTADGSHLLYLTDRSGSRDLMAVAIRGGAAGGEPSRLQAAFAGFPIRLTRTGDLFYQQSDGPLGTMLELVAERNPAGARVVQTFRGLSGTWSKNNQVAFFRPVVAGAGVSNELILRSLDTGEERLFRHDSLTNVSPRWLHDSSGVVVYVQPEGGDRAKSGSFQLADSRTGTFRRLFDRDTASHERSEVSALSPDSKTLYLTARKDRQAPWTEIVGVDMATGVERPIATLPAPGLPGSAPGFAVSPDGTTIVLQAWVGAQGSGKARLITVRVDGTDYRELYGPFDGEGFADRTRWTPDGQSIVFVAATGPTSGWRVMRIAATGGQPEFDGLASPGLTGSVPIPEITAIANMDLSPDGSRIIVGARTRQTWDVWVLENVKSLLTARQ